MRILADPEAGSPSPGSRGGTARCRRSLTTTYYRRDMEESQGGNGALRFLQMHGYGLDGA